MFGTPLTPTISRRHLLQLGGIGALGLSLPEFLQAGGSLATGGLSGPERSCMFIVQYGGASHIDSFDSKPDAPVDVRGPYPPISTRAPGLDVCELLPRLALQADKFAVVRSMTHGNGGHDGGMHVAMSSAVRRRSAIRDAITGRLAIRRCSPVPACAAALSTGRRTSKRRTSTSVRCRRRISARHCIAHWELIRARDWDWMVSLTLRARGNRWKLCSNWDRHD